MNTKNRTRKWREALKDIFRLGSLQSVIALSFAGISMITMIIIGIVFYSSFSENARESATESTTQIMNQAKLNMEYYLGTMVEVSDLIEKNMDEFAAGNTDDLKGMLELTKEIRSDIVSITIYSDAGSILLAVPDNKFDSNYTASAQDWFKRAVADPFEYMFQAPHVQRIYEDSRPWVVSLSRSMLMDLPEGSRSYISVVDMNFSGIEDVCSQVELGHRGYIYVVDDMGNIIYHPQQQLIYAGLKSEDIEKALANDPGSYFEKSNGEEVSTTVMDVEPSGWKMVGVSYVDEIVRNRENFNNLIILILFLGLAFIVLASIYISYKISQPIKKLEYQMKRVERGDFNIESLEIRGEDEVKRLTRSFNLMIDRTRKLMTQIIDDEEQKRKNELKVLQAQINPHFLYNTLDSIIWMNENKNHEGVSEMTAALAKLFRISLSKGREVITVEEEVGHAVSYLTIQKMRYKNKFSYSVDLPDSLKRMYTLKLLLQPIVENAIYHGINNIPDEGRIDITVTSEDGILVYTVRDNGYGIEDTKLDSILTKESKGLYSSGVGLKNVNERIKLYYGDSYGVSIQSEQEIGTTVYIRIPIKEAEND